jgi:hypothetical protein
MPKLISDESILLQSSACFIRNPASLFFKSEYSTDVLVTNKRLIIGPTVPLFFSKIWGATSYWHSGLKSSEDSLERLFSPAFSLADFQTGRDEAGDYVAIGVEEKKISLNIYHPESRKLFERLRGKRDN